MKPHNKTIIPEETDRQILDLLKEGLSPEDVINKLNLDFGNKVIYRRYRPQIEEGGRNRTIKIYEKILSFYKEEKRFSKIRETLKVKNKRILEALKWGNVKRVDVIKEKLKGRAFPVNLNYFEKIDSFEKAYNLGLLYADGCVFYDKEKRRFGVQISIKQSDSYILNPLNESVRGGRKMCIYYYKRGRGEPAVHFAVFSQKVADNLIDLGCFPRKSLTLKFPTETQVSSKFMPSFLRGYFDGDGSVCVKHPRIDTRICCSHTFAEELIVFLKEQGIKSAVRRNRGTFSDVNIGTKIDQIKFYKYIYQDKEFKNHLIRKKKKFEEVFVQIDEIEKKQKLSKNQREIKEMGVTEFNYE